MSAYILRGKPRALRTGGQTWYNYFISPIIVDLAYHEIFRAKVGNGGIQTRIPPRYGRAFAFGEGCPGFESGPHHTRGIQDGTSSSLADARIKGVEC